MSTLTPERRKELLLAKSRLERMEVDVSAAIRNIDNILSEGTDDPSESDHSPRAVSENEKGAE